MSSGVSRTLSPKSGGSARHPPPSKSTSLHSMRHTTATPATPAAPAAPANAATVRAGNTQQQATIATISPAAVSNNSNGRIIDVILYKYYYAE